MEIEVKSIKLTKSRIIQMDYIGVPKNKNVEVLGWVNLDKQKYVIVKSNNLFYRAEFITKIEKEIKEVQFPLLSGGYEYPFLTNIRCNTFNRGSFNYSPERDDEKNLELYEHLFSFKEKTEIAGQIYY
jgi:hypothetical protein